MIEYIKDELVFNRLFQDKLMNGKIIELINYKNINEFTNLKRMNGWMEESIMNRRFNFQMKYEQKNQFNDEFMNGRINLTVN